MVRTSVIVGAGGFGREIAAMVKNYFKDSFKVIGFLDDNIRPGEIVNNIEVLGGLNYFQNSKDKLVVFLGIADPKTKSIIVQELAGFNLDFPNLIHPDVNLHNPDFISLGKGNIICDKCVLTTNIEIGDFNLINLNSTIGHDVRIGSYCSIMPGVSVSGGIRIQDMVYVGTGARLINSITLNRSSIIGAGAIINTQVDSNSTYVGVPGKKLKSSI